MANPNLGDVLTYNGTAWVNQPWVHGNFGVGGTPIYPFHAFYGNSGFFYGDGSGTAIVGLYSLVSEQQWSFRNNATGGRLDVRDDTAAVERISIDTSGRVGIGTTSPDSLLQVNGAIATVTVAKSASYTLTANDSVVLVSAPSINVTITLPSLSPSIAGRQYTIKRVDGSAHDITVVPTGTGVSIDGAASYDGLGNQYTFVTLVTDGSNWFVVAQ